MDWPAGFAIYFILWWLSFFVVLPWGVRSPAETGEKLSPGSEVGAPTQKHARLWLKAAIATVIAALFWCLVYYLFVYQPISLESIPFMPNLNAEY